MFRRANTGTTGNISGLQRTQMTRCYTVAYQKILKSRPHSSQMRTTKYVPFTLKKAAF